MRLRNQQLEHQLKDTLKRDEQYGQQERIEGDYRREVLQAFTDMIKQHKAQQEDIFIQQKKPLVGSHNKKKLKALRNKAVVVEQQVLILRAETSVSQQD